jgi:hypothetical protein
MDSATKRQNWMQEIPLLKVSGFTRTLFLSALGRPAFASHLPVLLAPLFYAFLYILFFSPALLEGRILAPGDGYTSYYPAISIPWQLWEPNILAGYPVFADPQFFLWYPPRWVFRDYNTFIIFAYVAASSFSFGYIYWKTGSTAAALIAGAIYGAGSFMVGHLGHASIVQAAAWLPLIAWTIDALSHRRTRDPICHWRPSGRAVPLGRAPSDFRLRYDFGRRHGRPKSLVRLLRRHERRF